MKPKRRSPGTVSAVTRVGGNERGVAQPTLVSGLNTGGNYLTLTHGRLLAVGVNQDGFCEILGLMIGDSESEASWFRFFEWLKQRGLSGLDLVVSDDHKGLVKAVQRHFQVVLWQCCQVHVMRTYWTTVTPPGGARGETETDV